MVESKKRRITVAEKKRRAVQEVIWPGLDQSRLWLRLDSTGFITIPRTLPLVVEIINCMTKGAPAGPAYLELWCRSHDECFADLNDEEAMAFSAGFTGQRAVHTWRGRIQALHKLGFIDLQNRAGKTYALIWNPYLVIENHHRQKTPGLTEDHYAALAVRVAEIGARDLKAAQKLLDEEAEDPLPPVPATPSKDRARARRIG